MTAKFDETAAGDSTGIYLFWSSNETVLSNWNTLSSSMDRAHLGDPSDKAALLMLSILHHLEGGGQINHNMSL